MKDAHTHDSDAELATALKRAFAVHDMPPNFASTVAAAERRRALARRRIVGIGTAAAIAVAGVASVFTAFHTRAPDPETNFIEIAELLDSTRWTAPSDVLLPAHHIDLYQELPVLLESTEAAKGALL